ncbi:MAG TPA: twin-arginine translocation signal domain-containing protein, partial [Pyrinomonadaceae bacterium]
MTTSRRDFLRASACTVGGLALASAVESFGLVGAHAQAASDYRALVCVFLSGGNDGTNMVVPLDAEYDQYAAVRGPSGLAFAKSSLVPVNPPSQGRQYGLHPGLAPEFANPSAAQKGLLDVWDQGKLAVVCNVGPLVEPLTRATYQNGTGRKPLQLFSHSDQVNLWMSAVANSVSRTGWGGRLADRAAALNGAATFPQVVTISGISLFVTGQNALPLAINDSRAPLGSSLPLTMTNNSFGSATPADVPARRAAFDALRALDGDRILVGADSNVRASALRTKAQLDTAPNT